MTFLEYVAERLMGSPTSRSGGRSIWPCPRCDDSTAFSTLPPKEGCKDRFRCFRCGFWGDQSDLIKFFHPDERWPARRVRIAAWFGDFKVGILPGDDMVVFPCTSLRGPGRPTPTRDEPKDVSLAWTDLCEELAGRDADDPLEVLRAALKACESCDVSLKALVDYWQEYRDWIAEAEDRNPELKDG